MESMESIIRACHTLFDRSSQPFALIHLTLDEQGEPANMEYIYLNDACARLTGNQVDELSGVDSISAYGSTLDPEWFTRFYQAAYDGKALDFESTSPILDQFMHVAVMPVAPGYCAFFIQDITAWLHQVPFSIESVDSAMFIYDIRTQDMLVTEPVQALTGIEAGHTSLPAFCRALFGEEGASAISRQLESFQHEGDTLVFEGPALENRWFRLSVAHVGSIDRFAVGALEDITRAHDAEERSTRRMDVIDSISRENFALYLIDLDQDMIRPYRLRDRNQSMLITAGLEQDAYSAALERYLDSCVHPDDRSIARTLLDPSTMLERMDGVEGGELSSAFRRRFDDGLRYVEVRLVLLPNHPGHVVLAARNIHAEMQEQFRQREVLENALQMARHASAAKSTFLTNMSHDFRTPLNAISGFTAMALQNLDDPQRVQECLEKTLMACGHLTSLVNDILDISRIESGKTVIEEAPLSLHALAERVEASLAPFAQKKGVAYELSCDITHDKVMGDERRLNQVFINLMGNAFKFTDEGGNVRFAIEEEDNASMGYAVFHFTVADTGCGMVPEFLDRIFEPFERDGLGTRNRTEGSGLGMTIVKDLVDLMGGTIKVDSTVGVGTTFTIELPLKLVDAQQDSGTTLLEGVRSERGKRGEHDFTGLHALVVDDDLFSREIMNDILTRHGFTTDTAENGKQAVEAFAASDVGRYDVIMMDIRMPVMDGDDAAREIRALDRADAKTVPIIATTADAFDEGRRRTHEAGMTAHVTKPLNVSQLIAALESALAR